MRRLRTKGFILVATLWILAASTIAMTLFAAWVSRSSERARELQQDTRAAVAMFSTRETLLYLIATQGMTHRGVNLSSGPALPEDRNPFELPTVAEHEILLDGRVYEGLQRVRFSLQDEAGLVNLNQEPTNRQVLNKLLLQSGISDAGERRHLLSALRDYVQHGLERDFLAPSRQDYRQAERPEPLNRPLITSRESWRALGWEQQPALWEGSHLANLTTVLHYGGLNVNTAPQEVLQIVAQLDERKAQEAIEARQERGFVNEMEAELRGGLPMSADPFTLAVIPSQHLRLTLWHPQAGGRGVRYYITVTPERHGAGPWFIDHIHPISGVKIASGADPAEVKHPLFAAPDGGLSD